MSLRSWTVAAVVAATLVVALLLGLAQAARADDPTCGDAAGDWTGLLASTWTGSYTDGGTPYDVSVTLTVLGAATLVENLDTLVTYAGTFSGPDGYVLSLEGTGNSETLRWKPEALTCAGLDDHVATAYGTVTRVGQGKIGSVSLSRVL